MQNLIQRMTLTFMVAALLTVAPAARGQGLDILARDRRLHAESVTRLFNPVVEPARRATVQVMCDGSPAALGIIISADGLLVTKASELDGQSLGVTLFDARSFRARLLAVDGENDLALLRIAAEGLPAVQWAAGVSEMEPGRWVAAPLAPDQNQLAVGVISALSRPVAREGGVLGVHFPRDDDDATHGGVRVERVQPQSGAEAAGLRPNDIITHINGQSTPDRQKLVATINEHAPGQTVRVTYRRGQAPAEVHVTLGERSVVFRNIYFDRNQAISGDTSGRRNGFATVLQHHIPLPPNRCGGPLVDLDGKVVGLNIARANRSETFALPADLVQQRVAKLLEDLESRQVSTETLPTDPR